MHNRIASIKNCKGLSLIEIILGVAVLALFVSVIVGALIFGEQSRFISSQKLQAIDIAEEGIEAARNIRDESFGFLSTGFNGFSTTSNRWNLSGTEDVVENVFIRHARITQIDGFRKQITASTTWDITGSRQGAVQLITRLTDWRRRVGATAGQGATPTLAGTFDLTIANSGSNVHDAISIAFSNPYVYLGRVSNPGSEFYVFDVSNPTSPVLSSQINLNGDSNDMVASGNYVYIASSDNSEELQVIDVTSSSSPTKVATFDLTATNSGNGTADATSIAKSGNFVYLTRVASGGKEFIVFDVSTPTSPIIAGKLDLSGDTNEMTVSGNYVYLASTADSSELQVINVSTPSSPTLATILDLNSGDNAANGVSIASGANTIFFGRKGSQNAPELYVIDITTPTSPSLIATLDIGTLTLQSIDYSTTTALIYVAARAPTDNDYFAIDVTTPSSPALLTSLNLTDVPYKLIYGPTLDRVFIASGADNEELEIVAP